MNLSYIVNLQTITQAEWDVAIAGIKTIYTKLAASTTDKENFSYEACFAKNSLLGQ